jgi:hypothetical protein
MGYAFETSMVAVVGFCPATKPRPFRTLGKQINPSILLKRFEERWRGDK